MNKKYIENLITKNEIEKAIKSLMKYATNESANKSLLIQSSRFHRLNEMISNDTLDWDTVNIESNRIVLALIEISSKVFSKSNLAEDDIKHIENHYEELIQVLNESNKQQQGLPTKLLIFLGVILIALFVFLFFYRSDNSGNINVGSGSINIHKTE